MTSVIPLAGSVGLPAVSDEALFVAPVTVGTDQKFEVSQLSFATLPAQRLEISQREILLELTPGADLAALGEQVGLSLISITKELTTPRLPSATTTEWNVSSSWMSSSSPPYFAWCFAGELMPALGSMRRVLPLSPTKSTLRTMSSKVRRRALAQNK